jgi:hypothetical protein
MRAARVQPRAVLGYHLVFRDRSSCAIAPTLGARRRLARVLVRVGEAHDILAFRAAGDHLHVLAVAGDPGRAAQAIGSALTQALCLPIGMLPAHAEPLRDRRHFESAFRYVLRNADKHGRTDDPMGDGSAVQELLGLRIGGSGIIQRVRGMLPGIDRAALLEALGVDALVEDLQSEWLADAAAGAVGFPSLRAPPRLLRRAAAAAARVARALPSAEVAALLGMTARSVQRARALPPEPLLDRAIGLRMGLRRVLGVVVDPETPLGLIAPRAPVPRPGRLPEQ